jgi:hypothetical protein
MRCSFCQGSAMRAVSDCNDVIDRDIAERTRETAHKKAKGPIFDRAL